MSTDEELGRAAVRVELESSTEVLRSGDGSVPDEDGPASGTNADWYSYGVGGALAILALASILILSLLWWGAQPEADSDESGSTPDAVADASLVDEPGEASAREIDSPSTQATDTTPIFSPVRSNGHWFALRGRFGELQVVRSTAGLEWEDAETNLPEGVLALGRQGDVLTVLVGDPDSGVIDTYTSGNGVGWELMSLARRATTDEWLGARIQDAGRVVILRRQVREPVAHVSDVIANHGIEADVARVVCEMRRGRHEGRAEFVLVDCDGNDVGVMSVADSFIDSQLSLAVQVLDLRFAYELTLPDDTRSVVGLDAAVSPLAIAVVADGFLSLEVDLAVALVEPDRLFGGDVPTRLHRWSPQDGFVELTPPAPLKPSLFTDLATAPDGSAILVVGDHVFRSSSPFTNWELVAEWPTTDAPPRQISIVDGAEWLSRLDESNTLWVSPIGGEWRPVLVPGRTPNRVLLVDDTHIVVYGTPGALLRVAIEDLGTPTGSDS